MALEVRSKTVPKWGAGQVMGINGPRIGGHFLYVISVSWSCSLGRGNGQGEGKRGRRTWLLGFVQVYNHLESSTQNGRGGRKASLKDVSAVQWSHWWQLDPKEHGAQLSQLYVSQDSWVIK